ncbi:MAG: Kelch repeat-containing protein, partial [Alphaproteobacteria bacterium]
HHVYDPKEDKWRTAAPMPKAQAGLGGAVLNGRLYVFGGEIFDPEPAVFKEAWVYDPKADKWDALPPMPTPRHGLGAVALGDRIYCTAGATKPGGSGRSRANEAFVAG